MARKTTFNDPVRQVVQTVEDQHKYDTPTFRRLQVNAQPVNTYVTPALSDSANSLALAFAEAAPTLALLNSGINKQYHEEAYSRGQAARLADGAIDPKDSEQLGFFTSPSFQKGYMNLAGFQAGQQAAEELKAAWESDPNRNSMPTQEWISTWMKKNSPGNTDGAYLEGFNKEVVPVANALVGLGVKEKLDLTRANLNEKVTGIIKGGLDQGWNQEVATKIRTELQGDGTPEKPGIVGMSNSDWDKTFMTQVNQYIEAGGDPEKARQALKWTKEKRSDGTPGIYYKPGMAKVVDDLMDKAYSVTIQKENLQEGMDRVGRGGDARTQRDEVLNMAIDGKPDAALKQLNAMRKANPDLWTPGYYTSTLEKLKHIANLKKSGDGDGNSGALKDLIVGFGNEKIDTDAGLKALSEGKINLSQYGHFLSLTQAMGRVDKAIYKTPQFEDASRYLNSIPVTPGKDTFDMNGTIASAYRANHDAAVIELRQRIAENPKADPMAIAQEIKDKRMKFVESGALSDPNYVAYESKYPTKDAFLQALDAGKVSDSTKSLEIKYWKWMDNLAKKKGIK